MRVENLLKLLGNRTRSQEFVVSRFNAFCQDARLHDVWVADVMHRSTGQGKYLRVMAGIGNSEQCQDSSMFDLQPRWRLMGTDNKEGDDGVDGQES